MMCNHITGVEVCGVRSRGIFSHVMFYSSHVWG